MLAALKAGPMQKPVRVERVVDSAFLGREADREAECGGAVADHGAPFRKLLRCRFIFLGDMLDQSLSLRRHLRIELERLKVDVGLDEVTDPPQRLLDAFEADD